MEVWDEVKRKDKLAREFYQDCENSAFDLGLKRQTQIERSYIMGFEKARDMAGKRLELGFERHDVVQDMLDDFKTLGEDEA